MGFWDFMTSNTPGGVISETAQKTVTSIFDGLGKIIDEFHTSSEEKVQMKIALAEQKLKAMEAIIQDVQNARSMQIRTRSIWPGVMSTMSVIGFFGGFAYLMIHGLPQLDEFSKTIINLFAGAIIHGYASSQNFWLGSSSSSQTKDTLLYNSTPSQKP